MTNQLQNAQSPYLLQHANQPIFWRQWSDENLIKALEKDKLLLISIGYASCHWCHVMAGECFDDLEVAEIMNQHYTSFKIDREEFPAVDSYYMQALQIMTRKGGWPLNIVALPNGLPVWGSTYLPKTQWIEVLKQLVSLYESDPKKMNDYADKLHNGISISNNTLEVYPKTPPTLNDYSPLIEQWKKKFDTEYGGLDRVPKFMMPSNLNYLYRLGQHKNDTLLLEHVELTLTKMAQGGLFDVIEGGFSRYSVDHRWHIPHFEKMLYDNAQLLSTYTQVALSTNNVFYKEIVQKTVEFLLSHWQDASGGFYSAYDADSINLDQNSQEGAYYFWFKDDLKKIIPDDEWHLFSDVFSINSKGYWEEAKAYVLFQNDDLYTIAQLHHIPLKSLRKLKEKWENLLKQQRRKRYLPLLDDKIICSWNAMLLSGLLDTQKIIDDKRISKAIKRLSHFLQHQMYMDNELGRVFKNNCTYINGVFEDYAFTIKSFIDLFNHTQKIDHLLFAKTLSLHCFDFFYDEKQGFFKSDNQKGIGTIFEVEDNVIPSANAVMSRSLFYLGILFKNDYFIKTAEEMTNRVLKQINYASAYSDWLLNDLIFKYDFEYISIKEPKKKELKLLNKKFQHKIFLDNSLNIPILAANNAQEKRIQICNKNSCRLHTDDIELLIKQK